jgi:DNA-binding NtrC family response regulator
VLISGESGTGKELVAEALHRASKRNPHPLVKVSCAALPETLLETELFGHEKGSFTGAMTMRKGRFEMADKGTIFLDEIGEMTLGTQTKLLRILQEHEFERIGSNTPIKVDIRVIAATNRNLEEQVEKGKFREDLFYRLNVIHIQMPTLRDRKEDIPALVEHFLVKYRYTPGAIPTTITEDALRRLMEHDWPGNVRELENAIERAVVLTRGNPITREQLPFEEVNAVSDRRRGGRPARRRAGAGAEPASVGAGSNGSGNGDGSFKDAVESLEKRLIKDALDRAGGNRTKAAEDLGIYRRLLYAKIKEYGLGD